MEPGKLDADLGITTRNDDQANMSQLCCYEVSHWHINADKLVFV